MNTCSECGRDFFGRACPCGYVAKHVTKQPVIKYTAGKKASVEMMAECKKLLELRWENKITSFELCERMFDLDKKYKTAGFAVVAAKIYNQEATKLELEPMKLKSVNEPVQGARVRCAVYDCKNAGTMSSSTHHEEIEQARWVCKEHWR